MIWTLCSRTVVLFPGLCCLYVAQRTTSVSVLTVVPQSSHPLTIPKGPHLWNENTSQCPSSVPKKTGTIRAGSPAHGGPAARHEK